MKGFAVENMGGVGDGVGVGGGFCFLFCVEVQPGSAGRAHVDR